MGKHEPTEVEHNNIMLERRGGVFDVTHDLLRQNPDAVMAVTGAMLILRCESLEFEGVLRYTALSRLFDPVPLGIDPPKYQIIARDDYGELVLNVKKVTA